MTENPVVQAVAIFAIVVMVILLGFVFRRVFVGPGAADRLLGLELITTLLIGLMVLLAIVQGTDTFIDMGIVLAALSFAATLSIARYISEGRVF